MLYPTELRERVKVGGGRPASPAQILSFTVGTRYQVVATDSGEGWYASTVSS